MSEAKYEPRLKTEYVERIRAALQEKFSFANEMMIPKMDKIVINMGVGEATADSKKPTIAAADLAAIAGQKPVITFARNSIAGFKVRENMPIGAKVTLRGARMYEFMDRLINIALPRVRDFRGVPRNAFDGRGNYSLGLAEQIIFPEIDIEKSAVRGMSVTFVTSAETDKEGEALLEAFGFPFRKKGDIATQQSTAIAVV